MKRFFANIIVVLAAVLSLGSCGDMLDISPSDKITSSSDKALDAAGAEVLVNGVYRMLRLPGWGDSATENFGQTSVSLMADLMAEDMVIKEEGMKWFVPDYYLNHHRYYTGRSGRSYSLWDFHYTLINNVNSIIAAEDALLAGGDEKGRSVLGQAYALRAYAYFYLVQLFQQTYHGNEDKPGVPIYTEPTVAGAPGRARGTVADVYERINEDLETAVGFLQGLPQNHVSHIDYYVAKGIQARVALVQHDYKKAGEAAAEALKKEGLELATVKELGGFNNVAVKDIMWGAEIPPEQSMQYMSLFSHLDADADGMYASSSRKCISEWLYRQIPGQDDRRGWFRGRLSKDEEKTPGSMTSYCQIKFRMADYSTRSGDYIFMRAEEMLLIKAEAECHQKQYSDARATIGRLMELRDPSYKNGRLAGLKDSDEYQKNTNSVIVTLMDEILFQRRLELWGEAGRIFDLQRLGLGYDRDYEGSNHMDMLKGKNTDAASPLFIFPLPQAEIDANENISNEDQNPIAL